MERKRLHLALGVEDIERSVADYTQRLGHEPDLVIPNAYALWRTDSLNVSVRRTGAEEAGKLRHLGWESDDAAAFTSDVDCNGIRWESFAAEQHAAELKGIYL